MGGRLDEEGGVRGGEAEVEGQASVLSVSLPCPALTPAPPGCHSTAGHAAGRAGRCTRPAAEPAGVHGCMTNERAGG